MLTIAVIFLAIGLLNGSLYTIADNVGLKNLTHRDKVTDDWGTTSTERTQINVAQSQQEVQVVAEQGLEWYLSEAQATISKYKNSTNLAQSEAEDLAKALMIAKISGLTTDYSGQEINYSDFYKNNGIKVSYLYPEYVTSITNNDKTVKLSCSRGDSQLLEQKLNAVKSVYDGTFH